MWRREAQAEAEKTKIEELQKQITEERKQEEIFGVAAASGHVEYVFVHVLILHANYDWSCAQSHAHP